MDQDKNEESIPCSAGCGFFGRPSTGGMCSKCYKESKRGEVVAVDASKTVAAAPETTATVGIDTADGSKKIKSQVDRTRCAVCSKKVGLTGIECRCGSVFCGAHRIAEKHACTFDFKTFGRTNIEKANERVVAQSLEDKL